MASPFDAAMRAADAVVMATFGEPVLVTPRVAVPKRGPVFDPNRAAGTVAGVFTLTSGETPIEGSRRGSELMGFGAVAVAEGQLWLSAASLAALGFRPRKDDAVSFPDRDPTRTYVIIRVDPTDIGDLVLHINLEHGG
ncbi:MAG: hypothetical protein ACK4MV_07185 [Beijerinckiaceae bacterium]